MRVFSLNNDSVTWIILTGNHMTLILLAIWIGAPLVVTYQLRLFDRLIRWEYNHQRDLWERDGRPSGVFWSAKECGFLNSYLAMQVLYLNWMFKTPNWITANQKYHRVLTRLRLVGLFWNVCVLSLILHLAWTQLPQWLGHH